MPLKQIVQVSDTTDDAQRINVGDKKIKPGTF